MKLTQPTGRPNFHKLSTYGTTIYFSYETPIAIIINDDEQELLLSKNEWGPTTGKHINYLKGIYPNHTQVDHDEVMERIGGVRF